MTATIGNPAQAGSGTFLQITAGRAVGGARRVLRGNSEDAQSNLNAASEQAAAAEVETSGVVSGQTVKPVKRSQDNSNADSSGSSFGDTFDSIGQDATQVQASNSPVILPNIPLVQMPANGTSSGNSPAEQKASDEAQAVSSPSAALLKRASIIALMGASDRIFSRSLDMPQGDNTTAQLPVQLEGAADVTTSASASTPISVTVDKQQTLWNFANGSATSVAVQAAMVPTKDPNVAEAVVASSNGSLLNAPKTRTPDATVTSPAAMENSEPQTPAPLRVEQLPTASFSDSGNQSFGNPNGSGQAGTQFQNPATSTPVERKIEKSDSAPVKVANFAADASQPQAAASAVEQVRNVIVDGLAESKTDPGASASASTPMPPTRPSAAPMLRTLDLTLSPEDLGTVKLRLSLKSNSLAIEADASKASTAKLLNDDRASLERGLRDAGYDVSSMKIIDVSASSSSSGSNWQTGGSPSRDGDQARSGFTSGQNGEMQRRDASTFNQSQRRPKEDQPQTASLELPNARPSNAVYI
jgi:chemotaxis protein MotD